MRQLIARFTHTLRRWFVGETENERLFHSLKDPRNWVQLEPPPMKPVEWTPERLAKIYKYNASVTKLAEILKKPENRALLKACYESLDTPSHWGAYFPHLLTDAQRRDFDAIIGTLECQDTLALIAGIRQAAEELATELIRTEITGGNL